MRLGYTRINLNADFTLDVVCGASSAPLDDRRHFTKLDGWRYEALLEVATLTAELANGTPMTARDRRALSRITDRTKASTDE